MLIGMKSLNEEKNVDLIIGDIHDEPWVDRIIVIDGCSSDLTVPFLRRFSKVEVFQHKWEPWYHDNEVSQSNILMSYIPLGETYFILDFDERCSLELKEALADINENGMPGDVDCAGVSRRSYELMRYDDSPFAMKDDDGFWMVSHEIGQYPDFQMRIIRRKVGMHWVNSPHHLLWGVREGWFRSTSIRADVIHYHGKEDARDRDRVEIQWARCQAARKRLGLPADMFETRIRPDLANYADPKFWRDG